MTPEASSHSSGNNGFFASAEKTVADYYKATKDSSIQGLGGKAMHLPSPSEIANTRPAAAERGGHEAEHAPAAHLPSPSDIAVGRSASPQQAGGGQEYQEAGKWMDYVLGRGKDSTPYNIDKQHVLPEDEKEQRKEQEERKNQDQDKKPDNDRDGNDRGGRGPC